MKHSIDVWLTDNGKALAFRQANGKVVAMAADTAGPVLLAMLQKQAQALTAPVKKIALSNYTMTYKDLPNGERQAAGRVPKPQATPKVTKLTTSGKVKFSLADLGLGPSQARSALAELG